MYSGVAQNLVNPSNSLPASWAESCANVVEILDTPELPRSLASSLSTLINFDECKQIFYNGDTHPVLVYGGMSDQDCRAGLDNYLNNSYVVNPVYRMYRSGKSAGVYRLRDIAHLTAIDIDPKRHRVSTVASEEIGYLTDGMPAGNEELCIGLPMPNGACTMISLTRTRSHNGFLSNEVSQVALVIPFLASVFKRYWHNASASYSPAVSKSAELHPTLNRFNILSPREQEIVQLLIKGHSTLSISLHLEISATTVKTHRKNLYSKLGIATLCELFSLHANSPK
jgi:DNA-binding CsgD family transcriptional regulator